MDHTFDDLSHAGLPSMSDVAVVPAIGQIRGHEVARLVERTVSSSLSIRWGTNHANRMQGHRRFLANDRGTVSATARPALSGFGLQWAWHRFYQIALSPGPLQAAASRVLAWSQLARKKAGCLVRAQAVLPNHLMNTPRKPFPDLTPEGPHIFQQKNVLNSARGARYPRV